MITAKLFKNGQSQAVRLPKEFRFEGREVYVRRVGRGVLLVPKDDPWQEMADSLGKFTDDFMSERRQPEVQERNFFNELHAGHLRSDSHHQGSESECH